MNPATTTRAKQLTCFPETDNPSQKPTLLTAALTHEVRNPLTNINLAVEMLRHLPPGEAQQPYLDIIMRASKRIENLVTALAVKQHQPCKEKLFSVHQLLEEVLLMAADRIRLKNIIVTKDYTIMDHALKENYQGMKIALTNIIVNALDAMKEPHGVLKLVSTYIKGNYVLTIEDNGCGISAADLQNIFRPFFTRKIGGLGVGLAVTAEILKANDVMIRVESLEGMGTKFILSFTYANPFFLISNMA